MPRTLSEIETIIEGICEESPYPTAADERLLTDLEALSIVKQKEVEIFQGLIKTLAAITEGEWKLVKPHTLDTSISNLRSHRSKLDEFIQKLNRLDNNYESINRALFRKESAVLSFLILRNLGKVPAPLKAIIP